MFRGRGCETQRIPTRASTKVPTSRPYSTRPFENRTVKARCARSASSLFVHPELALGEAARSQSRPALALERLSARLRKMPLEDMLKHIETAAVQSAGGQPRDDIALLGLRLDRAEGG